MTVINSHTETASTVELILAERAKFGERFFAAIVDNIIINIPLYILVIFLTPLWSNPYFGAFFGICVNFVAVIGYFAFFAYKRKGRTWGKSWNNIKVVDIKGKDLSLGHFIVREFVARGIPIIASIFFGLYGNLWLITYLLALTKDKRALHDKIVGTQVIKHK